MCSGGVGCGCGWVIWGVGTGNRRGSGNFPVEISGKMCGDPKTGN